MKSHTSTQLTHPRSRAVPKRRKSATKHAQAARKECEARAEWRRAEAAYQDLEEFLAQEYERLVRLAASRGCNDPQDAVQDACLRAFESYDPSRGQVRPFFKTVLIRGIINGFRKFYHRERTKEPYENQCSEVQGNYSYSRERKVELLDQLLNRLPEDERKTLLACYEDEMLQDEVAVSLDIKPGTLRVRLFRARRSLRALFAQMGIESLADLESFDVAESYHLTLRRSPSPAAKSPRPTCRKSLKT